MKFLNSNPDLSIGLNMKAYLAVGLLVCRVFVTRALLFGVSILGPLILENSLQNSEFWLVKAGMGCVGISCYGVI